MGWESYSSVAGRGRTGRRRFDLPATLIFSAAALLLFASSAQALSPSVGSKAAANVDYSTATLNGTVNPNGLATKTYFEYGPTTSYGSKTSEVSVGSGSSALETAKGVTSLTPNTTYHYRVVATNADGTSNGADRTFHVGWAIQTPANSETAGIFEDVSCSSATECTAVGYSGGQAIAQRWNGSEWKAQTPAKPEGATETTLLGVSCPSSSACTAVGRYKNASAKLVTLVEFWNGSEWKIQSSPNPASTGAELTDVSCLSSNECTAVGYQWTEPGIEHTLALRWNGSEWKIQTTINPSNSDYLTSVSCTSSTFCMATGYYESSASIWSPLSEVWNGTEWATKAAVKPAGATMSWFFGVSCTSSTACTAVGDKRVSGETNQDSTMAQRWNGTSWSLQATPTPETTNVNVEDVSCTSSTACTAVGWANTGVRYPIALRWNGTEWSLQTLPSPSSTLADSYSVSCVATRGCATVGTYRNASSVMVPLAEANWRSAPATATTTTATSVGEKSATINGTVNPNGSETKAYFEYGTTTAYGSKTPEVNLGSGSSAVEKSEALAGLSPNTTYHYRIVANNENPETSRGSDQTFTTVGAPGVETTEGIPALSGEAATLKADVDPNGQATTYQFEYGTESGVYTKTVPITAESAGSGYEPKAVSYEVTGLTKNTKYYFRVTASNASGKVNGAEKSFSTSTSTLTSPAGTSLKGGGKFSAVDEEEISLYAQLGEENSATMFKCKKSVIEGEVVENKESAVKGSLSKLSFEECGNNTVTVLKPGSIEFQPTGGGSGKLLSTGAEITILIHTVFLGTEHCIYHTEETNIGAFSSSKNTGSTATFDTGESLIPASETGPLFCGEEAELEGSYSFTTPDYLDLD